MYIYVYTNTKVSIKNAGTQQTPRLEILEIHVFHCYNFMT